jgi:hypothetical protein
MSFNDPSFLVSKRPTDREREAEGQAWEADAAFVRRCYKRATWLIVLTMIFVAAPTSLEKWNWHVVIAAASLMSQLGACILWQRTITNGLLRFVFAWGILPA